MNDGPLLKTNIVASEETYLGGDDIKIKSKERSVNSVIASSKRMPVLIRLTANFSITRAFPRMDTATIVRNHAYQ